MKRYSKLPGVQEVEPHHQMLFNDISMSHLFLREFNPLDRIKSGYSKPHRLGSEKRTERLKMG